MRHVVVVAGCTAILVLTCSSHSNSQTTTSGGITGVVTDSGGAVVCQAHK